MLNSAYLLCLLALQEALHYELCELFQMVLVVRDYVIHKFLIFLISGLTIFFIFNTIKQDNRSKRDQEVHENYANVFLQKKLDSCLKLWFHHSGSALRILFKKNCRTIGARRNT